MRYNRGQKRTFHQPNQKGFSAMDIPEKLWDLANIVTGFAVAQSLAMIYGIGKGDFDTNLNKKCGHAAALILTLLFGIGYCFAIHWCYCNAKLQGIDESHLRIWKSVTTGRIASVILFDILLLALFGAHWYNATHPSIPPANIVTPASPSPQIIVDPQTLTPPQYASPSPPPIDASEW
jgi:hypothetical protein